MASASSASGAESARDARKKTLALPAFGSTQMMTSKGRLIHPKVPQRWFNRQEAYYAHGVLCGVVY